MFEPVLLSDREQQVVDLLLQGCENEDIAKELGIAKRTVKAHFNRMFLRFAITGGVKRVKLATFLYRRQKCQEQNSTEDMNPARANSASSNLLQKDSRTKISLPQSEPLSTSSKTSFAASSTDSDFGIESNSHCGTRLDDSMPPALLVEAWEYHLLSL
jgi:DNA-binding CsgD family transcriptional regulator